MPLSDYDDPELVKIFCDFLRSGEVHEATTLMDDMTDDDVNKLTAEVMARLALSGGLPSRKH